MPSLLPRWETAFPDSSIRTGWSRDKPISPAGSPANEGEPKRFATLELDAEDNLENGMTVSAKINSTSCSSDYAPLNAGTAQVDLNCQADGTHTVLVCVKDAANNLTKYPPVTVVVDRQGPAAVENLTIVGGSRQATLDWQVGQDAGDAGIQGYNVRYGGLVTFQVYGATTWAT